jgi:acyl-CoA hydrolase
MADGVRTEDTRVEMTHIVLPQFANSLGNVFGGQIMAWVDICAAVAAQRHCRSQVVTASIDAVHFIAPVKVGHILLLRETHKAAKAYATFVALDEEGCPRKVPGLIAVTEDDKRRVRDAQDRRAQRLALRKAQEQRAHEQEEKGL